MSKRQKRLQKIRQNPNDVSFEELSAILVEYGFTLERSSGSHHSFKVKLGDKWLVLVVPYRRPVKPIYVRDAIRIIDQIAAQSEKADSDESDDEKS